MVQPLIVILGFKQKIREPCGSQKSRPHIILLTSKSQTTSLLSQRKPTGLGKWPALPTIPLASNCTTTFLSFPLTKAKPYSSLLPFLSWIFLSWKNKFHLPILNGLVKHLFSAALLMLFLIKFITFWIFFQ